MATLALWLSGTEGKLRPGLSETGINVAPALVCMIQK